jgi:hypothetical protein
MWSPYFLGAKRAAAHLRVSTRKRATLQFSCVGDLNTFFEEFVRLRLARARVSQRLGRIVAPEPLTKDIVSRLLRAETDLINKSGHDQARGLREELTRL